MLASRCARRKPQRPAPHAVAPHHQEADPLTPEEWRHIEEAARACGVPPLRYVREAALAAKLPPRVRRRGAHELVKQLMRLLNNLHQLERVAEEEAQPTPRWQSRP